jgi:hypothetical protein
MRDAHGSHVLAFRRAGTSGIRAGSADRRRWAVVVKPVDQNGFGRPQGNCYAACLASILEVPLDWIPEGTRNHEHANPFLAPLGLRLVQLPKNDMRIGPRVLHILTGPSPRGNETLHATVGRGGQIIHDPHPSRAGLAGTERQVTLLVALVPAGRLQEKR